MKETKNLETMGSKAMESLNKLAELNMKVLEKITSRQMESMNFMMEQSKRQMKLASEAKGLEEFLKGQAELAKEASERLLEESKASMLIVTAVREDYRSVVQERMAPIAEEFRKLAPHGTGGGSDD